LVNKGIIMRGCKQWPVTKVVLSVTWLIPGMGSSLELDWGLEMVSGSVPD